MWFVYAPLAGVVALLVSSYTNSHRLFWAVYIALGMICIAVDNVAERIEDAIKQTQQKGE